MGALPSDATLHQAVTANLVDRDKFAVISHGWLARGHPDPFAQRRPDVRAIVILAERFFEAIFWDYLSLLQRPRTDAEEDHFRISLSSMHVVFSCSKWAVYRLLTIPDSSTNITPYLARGWCFFESGVNNTGAERLVTITNGETLFNAKSPMPLMPIRFAGKMKSLRFTSACTDRAAVIELYSRIFLKLVQQDELLVYAWGDDEVNELLALLPDLVGLKTVKLYNWSGLGCTSEVSVKMQQKLLAALKARGGTLYYPNGDMEGEEER